MPFAHQGRNSRIKRPSRLFRSQGYWDRSGDHRQIWPRCGAHRGRKLVVRHKIPSPGGYCSLDQRPLQDAVFWSGDDTHASLNGPFGTQEELNSAMIEKHLFNNLPVGKAAFYERSLSKVLRKHPPVFTHGDLQRKNIMITQILEVDEKGGLKDGDDFEVVLPDWEASGWYPSYWEYSRAMLGCGNFEDDWDYWLGQILEEFLMEWAWADMMFRELWSQTEEGINICTLYRGST